MPIRIDENTLKQKYGIDKNDFPDDADFFEYDTHMYVEIRNATEVDLGLIRKYSNLYDLDVDSGYDDWGGHQPEISYWFKPLAEE